MFDQESTYKQNIYEQELVGIPIRYTNNTMSYCNYDFEQTSGERLYSESLMMNQISCRANINNSGNWYTWIASVAGSVIQSGPEPNSICSIGWQMSTASSSDPKSFYHLIENYYSIFDNGDTQIINLPLSYIRAGLYTNNGERSGRTAGGKYWASNNAGQKYGSFLNFSANTLLHSSFDKYYGHSVRCVAR